MEKSIPGMPVKASECDKPGPLEATSDAAAILLLNKVVNNARAVHKHQAIFE